ncbi:MAG: hypothetical protein U9N59_00145 [Campylobacterota bacterium]|nr:hypothetical protein [Campylobacterota bacterium]
MDNEIFQNKNEEKFDNALKDMFKQTKVVKLKDITKKIAIISKVRVSNTREFEDYDEISLNNIDDYGEVFIPDNTVQKESASVSAIEAQSLNYGDLVLNQRTSKMKVGFIGREYDRVIVGNNSMIRIQFNDNDIDTARFVQLYLQLDFVQEYLHSITKCSKGPRKILSSAQLQELAIPEYIEKQQLISLSEVLYPRMKLLSLAWQMREDALKLIKKYDSRKIDSIDVNFQTEISRDLIAQDMKDIEVFMKFKEFYSQLMKE